MTTNWLVAIDDSTCGESAFNYITEFVEPTLDHLYMINVVEHPNFYEPYAVPLLLDEIRALQNDRSKKVLVHYGDLAFKFGIKNITLLRGTHRNPGELIVKVAQQYGIHHCVVGRRDFGALDRFFSGSTSQYVLENAECNVIVVKQHIASPEEHANKAAVIAAEEAARLQQIDAEVPQPEIKKAILESVVAREEAERARRIENEAEEKQKAKELVQVFRLKEKKNYE